MYLAGVYPVAPSPLSGENRANERGRAPAKIIRSRFIQCQQRLDVLLRECGGVQDCRSACSPHRSSSSISVHARCCCVCGIWKKPNPKLHGCPSVILPLRSWRSEAPHPLDLCQHRCDFLNLGFLSKISDEHVRGGVANLRPSAEPRSPEDCVRFRRTSFILKQS